MRLTTLLDTVNQGGSGQWPVTDSTSTTDDHQTFDQLVADFIPCRSNDPELWFAERCPSTLEELGSVRGVGPMTLADIGEDVLAAVRATVREPAL